MKNKNNIIAYIFTVGTLLFILTSSCSDERKELLPEDQFMVILNEITLTNSLFDSFDAQERYVQRDSMDIYATIFSKYGTTRETFESTFEHYFTKKPKKLIKIIDSSIGQIESKEAQMNDITGSVTTRVRSFWPNEMQIIMPDSIADDQSLFQLRTTNQGTYTLNFSITVFPTDKTINPHLSLWTVDADSLNNGGTRRHLPNIYYLKDGCSYRYSIPIRVKETQRVIIGGDLYDSKGLAYYSDKRAFITNISITFAP